MPSSSSIARPPSPTARAPPRRSSSDAPRPPARCSPPGSASRRRGGAAACSQAQGCPTYETPDEAVRAFMHLVDHRRNQDLLLETPPCRRAGCPRIAAARAGSAGAGRRPHAVDRAGSQGGAQGLRHTDGRRRHGGRPRRGGRRREPASAVRSPSRSCRPTSRHKSDIGGVHLDLRSRRSGGAGGARDAGAIARASAPGARISGFTVEEMVKRPGAHELIVGIGDDPHFGPIMLFGQGGTAVEVIGDRAIGLPPLNLVLAREMIGRTRIARLLEGYRDRPPADLDAIAAARWSSCRSSSSTSRRSPSSTSIRCSPITTACSRSMRASWCRAPGARASPSGPIPRSSSTT